MNQNPVFDYAWMLLRRSNLKTRNPFKAGLKVFLGLYNGYKTAENHANIYKV